MANPLLIVFAGLPGTGKTTLARRLSRQRGSCYLRVDVAETVLANAGLAVATHGYTMIQELAISNLMLGQDVVVDAVNAVPAARAGWREAASRGGADLGVIETVLHDSTEHQRRIMERAADIPGHTPPTWPEVLDLKWVPWDVERDGPRLLLETSSSETAWGQLLAAIPRR